MVHGQLITVILIACGIALGFFSPVKAEGTSSAVIIQSDTWDLDEFAVPDRIINVLTPDPIGRGNLHLTIIHRARQSVTENAGRDYLGLDAGGLKIGIGLRYGLRDRADVGLFRLNGTAETFDTYEFDVRLRLLGGTTTPVTVALRPGFTWFAQPEEEDASGFFGQLLLERKFGKHLSCAAGVLYHSESSGDRKSAGDDEDSMALHGGFSIRLRPRFSLDGEVTSTVSGYGEDDPAVSMALRLFTYGHTFSLVVTNTQYISADGIVGNAWRPVDEPVIGFNITRLFEL
jgi:hypothetical protein